ncbi:hypothetical protein [Streptomyces sp. NRRL F-5630]|uniref:hypothetical protein n=1 Tax=Streptomyces sp. NRRL F-5630 TaxID=1463864 RepID=UPI003D740022
MTSHPIPENHHHWWLVSGRWQRLHAIPGTTISPEQMRVAIDDATPVPAVSVCGLPHDWDMPGLASRLTLHRCTHCCHQLGIPAGHGTPANEENR